MPPKAKATKGGAKAVIKREPVDLTVDDEGPIVALIDQQMLSLKKLKTTVMLKVFKFFLLILCRSSCPHNICFAKRGRYMMIRIIDKSARGHDQLIIIFVNRSCGMCSVQIGSLGSEIGENAKSDI